MPAAAVTLVLEVQLNSENDVQIFVILGSSPVRYGPIALGAIGGVLDDVARGSSPPTS